MSVRCVSGDGCGRKAQRAFTLAAACQPHLNLCGPRDLAVARNATRMSSIHMATLVTSLAALRRQQPDAVGG